MKPFAPALTLAAALAAPLLALATPATSQPAPALATRAETIQVVMKDRKFRPQVIRLKRDVPVRILLVNRDVSGHNFSSKGFFSHADIRDEGDGRQAIHEGMITVPSQATRSFLVTPRTRGPFDLNSSVALDVASGMTGQILVY